MTDAQETSGYAHCACRDCFELTIASAGELDALCAECAEAECEPHAGECERADAYAEPDPQTGEGVR